MGSLVYLFSEAKVPACTAFLSIGDIPVRKSEDHDEALTLRLEELFKHKGSKKVVITTKRGEPILGYEEITDIVQFYRAQGELSFIHLVTAEMASDLNGVLVPNKTVA